jgi:hypothetical protein
VFVIVVAEVEIIEDVDGKRWEGALAVNPEHLSSSDSNRKALTSRTLFLTGILALCRLLRHLPEACTCRGRHLKP